MEVGYFPAPNYTAYRIEQDVGVTVRSHASASEAPHSTAESNRDALLKIHCGSPVAAARRTPHEREMDWVKRSMDETPDEVANDLITARETIARLVAEKKDLEQSNNHLEETIQSLQQDLLKLKSTSGLPGELSPPTPGTRHSVVPNLNRRGNKDTKYSDSFPTAFAPCLHDSQLRYVVVPSSYSRKSTVSNPIFSGVENFVDREIINSLDFFSLFDCLLRTTSLCP